MKTQTIHTNEMTLQPFFGRPANQATHNLTSAVSAPTVASTYDHKEVTMKTQITKQRINAASFEETRPVVASTVRQALGRMFGVAVRRFAVVVLAASFVSAQGGPKVVTGSTPGLVTQAQDLGPEDPGKEITVTVVLQRHNEAAFQQALQQMYTKGSPLYHKWFAMEQYAANFSPSAAESATVSDFLTSHNLNVTKTDKFNAYVTAEGTVADVQSAFHVHINRFSLNEKTYRANTNDVTIEGPAGTLVATVLGLDDVNPEPLVRRPVNPGTGQPIPAIPVDQVTPASFINSCFGASQTVRFHAFFGWPFFHYTGQKYDANNQQDTDGTRCAYTPGQVQRGYGLTEVYKGGNDGSNQAIGIVVAHGSPTIAADENYFVDYFGLIRPSMLIDLPGGTIPFDEHWALETTMDVEYASAMAPGAYIYLWVAKDASGLLTTLLDAVQFHCIVGINNVCANQISNSWGEAESSVSSAELTFIDQIDSQAASMGISVNFSTGDYGDYVKKLGSATVEAPASDVWVTAVGGTSLGMNSDDSILFQTGWGNNLTRISAKDGYAPFSPDRWGFQGGAGGGNSAFYFAPWWEKDCFISPGPDCRQKKPRKVPDVAFLADPYTGVQVIHTDNYDPSNTGNEVFEVGGGTSLAVPMFTGLWAVANEYFAKNVAQDPKASLGLAAPFLYWAQKVYPSAITDIQESSYSNREAYNVTGCKHRFPGTGGCSPSYSASYLIDATDSFVSALFKNEEDKKEWFVVSFGTDSSLHTTRGWDNVTGVGVPNGMEFLVGIYLYTEGCYGEPIAC
jgi:subtilase family serine protease